MLFTEEATGAMYIWNEGQVFACSKQAGLLYTGVISIEKSRATIQDALITPRKKGFTLNKLKYLIVAKGKHKEI